MGIKFKAINSLIVSSMALLIISFCLAETTVIGVSVSDNGGQQITNVGTSGIDLTTPAGLVTHEAGGAEADVSAYSGLVAISGGATSEVDDKSELEAQIADVSDFAEADGDIYSGVHDFGDTTSTEIHNAADVSGNTTEGMISWDTDDDKLYMGNGSGVTEIGASATAVTSTNTIDDNTVVRGDGGSRGTQKTGIVIDDSDNVGIGTSNFGSGAGNVVSFPNATQPAGPATDAAMLYGKGGPDSATKFLCHWDGADAATSSTDESASAHTITFVNTAQLDTAQKKFGLSSLLLDGNSDYTTMDDSADFDFDTGDFTVDFWVRFNDTTGSQYFFSQNTGDSGDDAMGFVKDSAQNVQMFSAVGGVTRTSYYFNWAAVAADTWYHLAFVVNGSNAYIFIDGVSQNLTEVAAVGEWGDYTGIFNIGRQDRTNDKFVNGWMDEVRISKGTARWTTNFTPQATPYSGTDNVELAAMDEDGNETVITPHSGIGFIPEDKLDTYYLPWTYHSKNNNTGRGITVDMEGLARAVETLTGQQFVYEEKTEVYSITQEKLEKLPSWIKNKRNEELTSRGIDPSEKVLLSGDPFVFGVFGDPQPTSEIASYYKLGDTIQGLNNHNLDFVVGLGDYIFGTASRPGHSPSTEVQNSIRSQFDNFFTYADTLNTTFYATPGNHDIMYSAGVESIYKEYFGNDLYYSFDYEGCHFIVLNSENMQLEKSIGSTQLAWLENDLQTHMSAIHTFVFIHRPIYPVMSEYDTLLNYSDVHNMLVQYGVDCVFGGHLHYYNHTEKDGIQYYVTGGAGGELFVDPENSDYHYLVVTVDNDNFNISVNILE